MFPLNFYSSLLCKTHQNPLPTLLACDTLFLAQSPKIFDELSHLNHAPLPHLQILNATFQTLPPKPARDVAKLAIKDPIKKTIKAGRLFEAARRGGDPLTRSAEDVNLCCQDGTVERRTKHPWVHALPPSRSSSRTSTRGFR